MWYFHNAISTPKVCHMTAKDLEIFNQMPITFYIRDKNSRFLWANNAMQDACDQDLIGKNDEGMPWQLYREELVESDRAVFATGETYYRGDWVMEDVVNQETLRVSICKWLDEFEGEPAVFCLGFVTNSETKE